MFRPWKLGRFVGIDVFLHPTLLLLLFYPRPLQGGPLPFAVLVAAYTCVLLHEYGHALAARRFGIPTADITLYPIGGVARLKRIPRAPGVEFLVALAGPAVNLAIAAGLVTVMAASGVGPFDSATLAGTFLASLLWVNVGLALFNLLPVFPMDGGRLLRAFLSGFVGRLRATRVAATVGRGLALAGGVYFLANGMWLPTLLAVFVYFAAGAEARRVELEEEMRRRSQFGEGGDQWTAPSGFRWVRQPRGLWRLTPVFVTTQARGRSR